MALVGGTSSAQAQSPVEAVRRYLDTLPQDYSVREELCSHRFWKAARAELLAAILLIVFGCGATMEVSCCGKAEGSVSCNGGRCVQNCTSRCPDGWEQQRQLKSALALCFTVATLVQCVGNISGCHLNPAISLAMLVTRHVSALRAAVYVTCQCLGAAVGALILAALATSSSSHHMAACTLSPGLSPAKAFGVEFMATFLVVLTTMATLQPHRLDVGFKALSIGLAYAAGHLYAYQYTGGCMNPARALGPALVSNIWDRHWVYWLGPSLGALLGAFTYEYTHDSSSSGYFLRRSFRRKGNSRDMRRDVSMFSSNTLELNTPCGSHDGRM